MHVTAIIAAGGRGHRLGNAEPKQLLSIGGRPILERSIAAFASHPSIDAIVVALPQELADEPPAYLRSAQASARQGIGKPVSIVAGGVRRQDSVANAFAAVDRHSDVIVIHDAARPFASADLIARTVAAAAESGAAVAAVQSRDTVKRVAAADGRDPGNATSQVVAETLDRATIFLAQTPQAFRREILRAALAAGESGTATDEASLAERAGHAVRLVDGEATNIKITTPDDLTIGEAIASSEREGSTRPKPARTG